MEKKVLDILIFHYLYQRNYSKTVGDVLNRVNEENTRQKGLALNIEKNPKNDYQVRASIENNKNKYLEKELIF